ncbi:MAG: hypothetical protein PHS62_01385 [Patescibacteria group bacterium]|nr:hypothetical protein [Patescibacteria group bacterium]
MKKIGEGWQYSIYDLGNGRVFKKFHSPLKSYWVILKSIFPFRDDSFMMIPNFSKSSKQKALTSFEIIKSGRIPGLWIGNPKFLAGLDYEQDKAIPLHDVFLNSNTELIKSIIDKFIVFNRQLLEIGVIDKSFNITKNYGLDEKGNIVLIDIGEIFDDPERIKKQLSDRAWDKNYVAGCIKNIEAEKYFVRKMDENFCLDSNLAPGTVFQ